MYIRFWPTLNTTKVEAHLVQAADDVRIVGWHKVSQGFGAGCRVDALGADVVLGGVWCGAQGWAATFV